MQNVASQEPGMQYQEEWEGDVRHSSADSRAELYSSPHLDTISLPVVSVSYDQPLSENTE